MVADEAHPDMAFGSDWWRRRSFWIWPAAIVIVVIGFTIAVVRPFHIDTPADEQEIAAAWNESISLLGILPVFPPQEDISVGDIFAVISDEDRKSNLFGRSVRIGHVDLSTALLTAAKARTVFPETAELATGQHFRHQNSEALTAGEPTRISLTLVSFPGIVVRSNTGATSAVGLAMLGADAGRDQDAVVEISIPVAERYGVDAPVGLDALKRWCEGGDTKNYCTDEYARGIIAYSIDPGVLDRAPDGTYKHGISLNLVNSVYLTREIDQRRSSSAKRRFSGSAPVGADGAAPQPSLKSEPGQNSSDTKPDSAATNRSGSLTWTNSTGSELHLQQVFQRPLVFGFRSVVYSMTSQTQGGEAK